MREKKNIYTKYKNKLRKKKIHHGSLRKLFQKQTLKHFKILPTYLKRDRRPETKVFFFFKPTQVFQMFVNTIIVFSNIHLIQSETYRYVKSKVVM